MDPVTASTSGEKGSFREARSDTSEFKPQEEEGVRALKVYTVEDKIQMIRRFEAEGANLRGRLCY